MKKIFTVLYLISATCSATELKKEDVKEWQIAPMGGISSFTKSKDIFYEMPFREPYYYEVKYNRNPTSGDLAFGDQRSLSAGMIRHNFSEEYFKQYVWADVAILDDKILFVDSWNYRIFYRDMKTNEYSRNGDIIIDRTKPADDSRGVAPPVEINSSRYQFKKSLKSLKFPSDGFISFSPLGEKLENDGAQFLVLTGLRRFPIVTMKCDLGSKPSCSYRHTCMGDRRLENSSAMYFHPQTRRLLLVDSNTNNLKIFKYNSCYDIKFVETIKFPEKIPEITDLHLDDDGTLWTSYKKKDQYLSAILVKWKMKLKL